MKGREGVGERGQGCFLFSQLIDSQMSGGVGFVVGLKHPVTLFPSINKHNTYAHARQQRWRPHLHTCMHMYLWPYCLFRSHTPFQ